MWQLLWLNETLRQHGLSDLHLDFFVFFSNQYFGRKFRSKGLAQEDYEWKMIEPKINRKTWFKSRSIKFEPLKSKSKCRSRI